MHRKETRRSNGEGAYRLLSSMLSIMRETGSPFSSKGSCPRSVEGVSFLSGIPDVMSRASVLSLGCKSPFFIVSFVEDTKGLPVDVPAETFRERVKDLVVTVENVLEPKLRKEEEEEQGGSKEGEDGRKKNKEEAKRPRLWDAIDAWFVIGCEV